MDSTDKSFWRINYQNILKKNELNRWQRTVTPNSSISNNIKIATAAISIEGKNRNHISSKMKKLHVFQSNGAKCRDSHSKWLLSAPSWHWAETNAVNFFGLVPKMLSSWSGYTIVLYKPVWISLCSVLQSLRSTSQSSRASWGVHVTDILADMLKFVLFLFFFFFSVVKRWYFTCYQLSSGMYLFHLSNLKLGSAVVRMKRIIPQTWKIYEMFH